MGKSDPSRSDKPEYVPRSPRTATKVHNWDRSKKNRPKIRKYELVEKELEKEIEETLVRLDSSKSGSF